MKTTHFAFIAAVTALSLFLIQPACAAENKAASKDANFIKKVADANMTEIKLANLAKDNGQKQEVKDFADRMIKDHTNAGDQLKPIAQKLNVDIPDTVSAEHQQTIDKLSKLKGDEFDKAYASAMVKDHKKVVSMFEKNKDQLQDKDLKEFDEQTLPTLKEHLELAKKLEPSK